MSNNINIIGICRFSMIGRGDWKAYRKIEDDNLESIYKEKEKELFNSERMEARFQTFENLTLASLDAQTSRDFKFLVISSDRMPMIYQDRLISMCKDRPYIILRFTPPMHIADAQLKVLEDIGIDIKDCLQFRLDDDDFLSKYYISKMRKHAEVMWDQHPDFAVSFPSVIYSIIDGPTKGLYKWFDPFLGVGVAVRHTKRTVFGFAHYKIPTLIVAVTDPSVPSVVTHYGMNDTPRHAKETLTKRGMIKTDRSEFNKIIERHFDYLTDDGLKSAGF